MTPLVNQFALLGLSVQQFFQRSANAPAAPEFLEWRHQFLLRRLTLLCWVMLGILSIFGILLFTVAIPSLHVSGKIDRIKIIWTIIAIAGQGFGLLLTLALLRHSTGRNHPERLFLMVGGVMVLFPQVLSTFFGEATLDSDEWILFFSTQAILIPVCWPLHLLSQVSVLGLFLVKAIGFDMRDHAVPHALGYLSAITYTLMVCAIADGGVYLYERALRKEFELRQQVQVFLHAVSHDLRNPILGTLMTLKALRTSGKALSLPDEVVVQMIESGDRQIQLINTLLEAHATETHGVQLQTQAIDLNALVQSILVDLKPFIDNAQAHVTLAIAPTLPPTQIDALQIRRVYENLISNALKYNGPGLHLILEAEVIDSSQKQRIPRYPYPKHPVATSSWIRCTVSDNGTGMTKQQCDRLFDLYSRGTSARQTLGLGLGLYICRQIVMAHGGEMGVLSQLGHGTTFWFTLPVTN